MYIEMVNNAEKDGTITLIHQLIGILSKNKYYNKNSMDINGRFGSYEVSSIERKKMGTYIQKVKRSSK